MGRGVGCSSGGRESRRCRPGSLPFPLPEGEEGQEEEAGGRRTRTVAGRRFTLAGKDDLGEREEEVEYCFKDFHKLEGFFNF